VSWANTVQVTTPFDAEEIEVNNLVGELWGLKDGMNVSSSVIQNSQPLKSITISLGGEDFDMAECSAERIQYDMLDQLSIVARYQPVVIWLNKSISVKATVGEHFS
jgi:Peroxisome biogenesis factor 1, N-terminal